LQLIGHALGHVLPGGATPEEKYAVLASYYGLF
jgi:hypothetical protein